MDGRRRLFSSNESALQKSPCSHDGSAKLWHSTPVKKADGGSPLDAKQPSGLTRGKLGGFSSQWVQSDAADPCSAHHVQDAELPVKDLSVSTLQRQRKELQLLMAELKDRERELNAMSASHHKQHQAWEQDRHTVVMLERRCAGLEEELQSRNEVIRVLTKHVGVVESREKVMEKELGEAKQLICELEKKQQHINEKCQDYEAKNQSLTSTVMALSTQVGSLQVREEELSSMLKLKDKDVSEASGHVLELSGKLQVMETSLAESRSRELQLLRDLEEVKSCYRESERDFSLLREELQQQVTQSSTQREEIIRLKQELKLLHADLALTGEGESWKDELLELSRSKQERIMSELLCLQQVCENQRKDLQLLRLNQGSTQRALREKLNSQEEWDVQGEVQGSMATNSKPGGLSSNVTDAADQLSACSLNQLWGKSSLIRVLGAPDISILRHPLCESQTAHQQANTTILKSSDAPPKACLHHGVSQPDSTGLLS